MAPRRVSLRAASPEKRPGSRAAHVRGRVETRSPSPGARRSPTRGRGAPAVRESSDIEFEDGEGAPAPPPAKAARTAVPKKAGASAKSGASSKSSKKAETPAPEANADEDGAGPSSFPKTDAWRARDPAAVARWRRPRTLRQCVEASRGEASAVSGWSSSEAPPSVVPRAKYCDVTGLPAVYVDPATRLRYYSADVFAFIRTLSPEQVQQYLRLRHAHTEI